MIRPRLAAILAAALLAGSWMMSSVPASQAQATPTVRVTAPANAAAVSNPVTVTVTTGGATIKAATDNDPNAAHLHYFIDRDPAEVLRPGQPIPSGQPDIIHTPDTSQTLPTLSAGPHNVWVVLAHTDHTPYSPNVQDKVSFTIGGAAQSAAPAAGAAASAAASPQMPRSGNGGMLASANTGHASIPSELHTVRAVVAYSTWLAIVAVVLVAFVSLLLRRRYGQGRL